MSTSRQLAAILFADIQGYTALMQDDEAKANALREKLKKNLEREVLQYNGRVLKSSGDGALCIFNSAIEAVRAAIGIQKAMLQEPPVPLRIGIHTGDVMFEDGDVYGDGVNVASRIESFAVAGSVFISGKVFDEIKNQKDIETVSLGTFELKNVNIPVEIFAVSNDNLVVPKKETLSGKGSVVSDRKFSSKKSFIVSSIAILLLVISAFLYKKYAVVNSDSATLKTIAVIPFANLSTQKDDEYFTDGMCTEIQSQLSKIGALNVISRTSMLQFKDSKKTMKEIGEAIGADVLLEGSVQKSNDKVHINVQLIDAKQDKQLWADTYDKEFKDIFSIQGDVAKSVAMHLKANLTPSEKARIEKKPTNNMEAYNLYLKGNFYVQKVTPDDLAKGLAMMNEAIKLDPTFALPYIGIAYYYIIVTDFYMAPSVAMPQLKIAVETAVMMDTALASAHNWLGIYDFWYAWDWEKAHEEITKGIELAPNDYWGHFIYSWYFISHGQAEKAFAEGRKMVELEPQSPEEITFYGFLYYLTRKYDEALPEMTKASELDANYPFAHFIRGQCYIQQGKFAEAVTEIKKADDLFAAPWSHGRLAYAYARAGNIQMAKTILDALKKQSDTMYVASDVVASVYIALGDMDNAFIYLEKAFNERAGWMLWIKMDPIWDPIRNDPRFIAIVKKMGL
jgi:adenylate cyclase